MSCSTRPRPWPSGPNYPAFRGMESTPHGAAHVSFNGWISDIPTAPKDPLFFMLHSNVDRLWALWQWMNQRTNPDDPNTYTGQNRDGRRVNDTMWPWNGVITPPRPNFAPGSGLPGSPLTADTRHASQPSATRSTTTGAGSRYPWIGLVSATTTCRSSSTPKPQENLRKGQEKPMSTKEYRTENRAECCEGSRDTFEVNRFANRRGASPPHGRQQESCGKDACRGTWPLDAGGRSRRHSGNGAPTPCRSKGITGRASRSAQAVAAQADLQLGRRRVETRVSRGLEDGSR